MFGFGKKHKQREFCAQLAVVAYNSPGPGLKFRNWLEEQGLSASKIEGIELMVMEQLADGLLNQVRDLGTYPEPFSSAMHYALDQTCGAFQDQIEATLVA